MRSFKAAACVEQSSTAAARRRQGLHQLRWDKDPALVKKLVPLDIGTILVVCMVAFLRGARPAPGRVYAIRRLLQDDASTHNNEVGGARGRRSRPPTSSSY